MSHMMNQIVRRFGTDMGTDTGTEITGRPAHRP
jgi:hypothetical protein